VKWIVVIGVGIFGCLWVTGLPTCVGRVLFPSRYAVWDFTSDKSIGVTGWPEDNSRSYWLAPQRHLIITTPGHSPKSFYNVVGWIGVERHDDRVHTVDVVVYYETFEEALAKARQFAQEYHFDRQTCPLDRFEQEVIEMPNAHYVTNGWVGSGDGLEVKLSGASAKTLWYVFVTFTISEK
jgi:hypothetical protein